MNKKILLSVIGAVVAVAVLIIAIVLGGGSKNPSDPHKTGESTSETVSYEGSLDGTVEESKSESTPTRDPVESEQTIAGSAAEPDEPEQGGLDNVPSGGIETVIHNDSDSVTSKQNGTTTTKRNPTVSSSNTSKPVSTTAPKNPSDTTSKNPSSSTTTTKPAAEPDLSLTYKEYISLSPAEQQAYFETFASIDDYFTWYNAAKKAYEDEQNRVEITGGIDIGDLIGGK